MPPRYVMRFKSGDKACVFYSGSGQFSGLVRHRASYSCKGRTRVSVHAHAVKTLRDGCRCFLRSRSPCLRATFRRPRVRIAPSGAQLRSNAGRPDATKSTIRTSVRSETGHSAMLAVGRVFGRSCGKGFNNPPSSVALPRFLRTTLTILKRDCTPHPESRHDN